MRGMSSPLVRVLHLFAGPVDGQPAAHGAGGGIRFNLEK